MSSSTGRIAALRRFPVKGLSPEQLDAVDIESGRQIAGDRAFAIENGPSGFEPDAPKKIPKTRFLCLMRNARLAGLATSYDPATGAFEVRQGGAVALSADLGSPDGRAEVERWFTDFMAEEARGPLKLLTAPGRHTFSDTAKGFVSIINLASVSAVEELFGAPVDPLRFRGNLDVSGLSPWEEFDWVGRTVMIGDTPFRVVDRTVRCAATEVDPTTADRDLKIPATLMRRLGHADCGVYAEALAPGRIQVGAPIRLQ